MRKCRNLVSALFTFCAILIAPLAVLAQGIHAPPDHPGVYDDILRRIPIEEKKLQDLRARTPTDTAQIIETLDEIVRLCSRDCLDDRALPYNLEAIRLKEQKFGPGHPCLIPNLRELYWEHFPYSSDPVVSRVFAAQELRLEQDPAAKKYQLIDQELLRKVDQELGRFQMRYFRWLFVLLVLGSLLKCYYNVKAHHLNLPRALLLALATNLLIMTAFWLTCPPSLLFSRLNGPEFLPATIPFFILAGLFDAITELLYFRLYRKHLTARLIIWTLAASFGAIIACSAGIILFVGALSIFITFTPH